MTDAAKIVRRWERLASDRTQWESNWQDIADNLLGRRDFLTSRTAGSRRDLRIFDGTAMQAADLLAASLHGMMTNPSTRWFSLAIDDDRVARDEEVTLWLETVEDSMLRVFGDSESEHPQACHEFYLDLGTFATAGMFVGDAPGRGVLFSTRALGELYIAENAAGRVDTVFRKFKMTARQAKQEFGEAGPKIEAAIAADKQEEPFEFVHAVYPREEYDGSKRDSKNMPFASCYVSLADKKIVSEGGFHEMPYLVARWSKDAGETYGRGPGWNALADTNMLNAMSKTVIKAAQKVVDPPLLVADDGVVLPVRTVPGGLNFGRMDARGPFIQPLQTNARLDIGLEMMEQRRQAIRSAFYADVLQVMRDPRMTAAQVYQIANELMRTMGPVLGRLQSEFLGPMIDRVFAIMWRQGQIPDPPLQAQGHPVRVEYISPMAKAQKASVAQAVLRTYEPAIQLAAIDPSVMDNLDNDEAIHILAEANGAPMKMLRDKKARDRIREDRAEKQQAMENMQVASGIAEGASKVLPAILGGTNA